MVTHVIKPLTHAGLLAMIDALNKRLLLAQISLVEYCAQRDLILENLIEQSARPTYSNKFIV